MALYTILFGLSIFMIALVVALIKKMFFVWKVEHANEGMKSITTLNNVERPAVSLLLSTEKCVIRCRKYTDEIQIYDVISKSDISLSKEQIDVNIS